LSSVIKPGTKCVGAEINNVVGANMGLSGPPSGPGTLAPSSSHLKQPSLPDGGDSSSSTSGMHTIHSIK